MFDIRHLKKRYGEQLTLNDLSFTINRGDVISVIGPSGTGKSTLLRCINMLERPTSGQIFFEGEEVTDPRCDINRYRMRLGMVFQSFNLYAHLTVLENCMLAQTVLLKRSRQEAYDRAMELLHSVGMEKLALRYPEYLSGGQKQRAAIARTLSTDPEFVLFDEPTSSLDPLGVTEVENVISRLASEGRTMMIVTHSMELARRASNRVMFLSGGEIYEEGTPEQIFGSPQREKTRKFVRRLLSLEMTVEEVAHDLNEQIGRVYAFCADRGVDAKRIVNACASYEEGYCLMLRYVVGTDKTVNVSVEYDVSEDRLSMAFTPNSVSDDEDIENTVYDSLEYKLIRHYSKSSRCESDEGDAGFRFVIEL